MVHDREKRKTPGMDGEAWEVWATRWSNLRKRRGFAARRPLLHISHDVAVKINADMSRGSSSPRTPNYTAKELPDLSNPHVEGVQKP